MNNLYADITGITNPLSVNVQTAHSSSTATAVITALEHSLSIGDSVEIDLGYDTNHDLIFTGYVKAIKQDIKDNLYSITASDELIRAVEYFIVSPNPDSPYSWQNIQLEDLIEAVLNMAGITNYTSDPSYFTMGVSVPIEVNLVSAYDFCRQMADLLAWNLWADENGLVHYEDRRPYPVTSDTGSYDTIASSEIITYNESYSVDTLRNKVVVYGRGGITAVASASSPYLPAGFYKTTVIAGDYIAQQWQADDTASYNLDLLNRLKHTITATLVGDPKYLARGITYIPSVYSTDKWYIYAATHDWGAKGYTVGLELRHA